MNYLWYVVAVLCSVLQSATAKIYHRDGGSASAFNIEKSLFAFVLFTAVAVVTGFSAPIASILCGSAYGVSLTVSMYCGYKALNYGPMALTGLIVSFSVVMPVLYGILFCDEGGSYFQVLGFLCFAAAMIFVVLPMQSLRPQKKNQTCTEDPKEKQETSLLEENNTFRMAKGISQKRGRWVMFIGATFLCNGVCAILQKAHGIRFGGAYSEEFMFFAMSVCTAGFGMQALLVRLGLGRGGTPAVKKPLRKKRVLWLAALSGICNATANYATTCLSATENASVLFPAVSIGTVCVSLLCGWMLFAEKPRWNHVPAFVLGVCAIVFLRM